MSEEAKNLGGRPPFAPTPAQRKQVETLSGYGIPQDDIARSVGISKPTLLAHFRDELDLGMTKANSLVVESLFKKATGDGPASVTAAIFWLKCRARWREETDLEKGESDISLARRIKAALNEIEGATGDTAEA